MTPLRVLCSAALTVSILALSGCGGEKQASSASQRATVQAWSVPYTGLDERSPPPKKKITVKRMLIQVRPHCLDRSHAVDCEGLYTFVAEYQAVHGRTAGTRCLRDRDDAMQFVGDPFDVGLVGSSEATGVVCDDAIPGKLTVQAVMPMSGRNQTATDAANAPPAAFQVTMRVSVDRTGVQRYEWRGRDGAHCAGIVPKKGVRRTECRWE